MKTLDLLLPAILAFGIFNVWFVREKRSSPYRGGDAPNLQAEFASYGLSSSMFYLVGGLKVLAAVLLLLGYVMPVLVQPAAALLALLMLGAVLMHAKVKDPAIRYLPASLMLLMALLLLL
jgi:uncharacterized membrane protein YphA (DoxX/SURF4 family)